MGIIIVLYVMHVFFPLSKKIATFLSNRFILDLSQLTLLLSSKIRLLSTIHLYASFACISRLSRMSASLK